MSRKIILIKQELLLLVYELNRDRKSGSAGMPRPISYAVFCFKKKNYIVSLSLFFFFNDTATTEIYTLSLHDALPILLKFMRASIKMIGVSNLQSFIASMTQKLTLSDISDESKNYLDKAGITTACLRIKSKWTAGGK